MDQQRNQFKENKTSAFTSIKRKQKFKKKIIRYHIIFGALKLRHIIALTIDAYKLNSKHKNEIEHEFQASKLRTKKTLTKC